MKVLTRYHLAVSNESFPSTCGLEFGNCLIDHRVLLERVSGNDYLNFLGTHLSVILEDVPFSTCLHIRFEPEVLHHNTVLTGVSSCTIIVLDWSRS
jgi:hypothetical protein